jgi:hypothetical protein
VVIPTEWRAAKQDPKWNEASDAMLEDMVALQKNNTWELGIARKKDYKNLNGINLKRMGEKTHVLER